MQWFWQIKIFLSRQWRLLGEFAQYFSCQRFYCTRFTSSHSCIIYIKFQALQLLFAAKFKLDNFPNLMILTFSPSVFPKLFSVVYCIWYCVSLFAVNHSRWKNMFWPKYSKIQYGAHVHIFGLLLESYTTHKNNERTLWWKNTKVGSKAKVSLINGRE